MIDFDVGALILIGFLGHSSIHPALDDYLLAGGIKKRPKKNEASETITDKKSGVELEFQISPIFDKEALSPKKSDGRFILASVTFLKGCSLPLPYGISLQLGKDAISRILGNPLKEREQIPLVTYYHENMVITVNWNKNDPAEAFIRFTVPNIYHKKNLGI